MPARSEAQQRLFGMALAAKRGKGHFSKKIQELSKSMSEKQLHDFAATKHEGLPEKKASWEHLPDYLKQIYLKCKASGNWSEWKEVNKNIAAKRVKANGVKKLLAPITEHHVPKMLESAKPQKLIQGELFPEFQSKLAASILHGLSKAAADINKEFNHIFATKEKPLTDKRLSENKPILPKDDFFKIPKHREHTTKIAKDMLHGGKADNMPDSRYNQKVLARGEHHEQEHTTNKMVAREIAKDHLEENKDYYKLLEKAKIGTLRFAFE
jgi:hypothetical protein